MTCRAACCSHMMCENVALGQKLFPASHLGRDVSEALPSAGMTHACFKHQQLSVGGGGGENTHVFNTEDRRLPRTTDMYKVSKSV